MSNTSELKQTLENIYSQTTKLTEQLLPYSEGLVLMGRKRIQDASISEKVKTAKLIIGILEASG